MCPLGASPPEILNCEADSFCQPCHLESLRSSRCGRSAWSSPIFLSGSFIWESRPYGTRCMPTGPAAALFTTSDTKAGSGRKRASSSPLSSVSPRMRRILRTGEGHYSFQRFLHPSQAGPRRHLEGLPHLPRNAVLFLLLCLSS